jgi:hypothetical protein
MIGVVANADDLQVAEEFFELFKTPWQPAVPARKYPVVLSAGEPIDTLNAESFLVYGCRPQTLDREAGVAVERVNGPADIDWGETTFPVYGGMSLFNVNGGVLKRGEKAVDYRYKGAAGPIRRIGYDLFREVTYLLTEGQPASRAATPTLDLHIDLLRLFLVDLGVPFLEIPARPDGHDFVCCLTHDVDFFGIRRHRFDRTFVGFAVRASVGTLVDLVRARRTLTEAIRNWAALLSLPLVFLKLMPDFWRPFYDYAIVEKGRRSTYFLIPFKGRPGIAPDGAVNAARAAPYQVSEIRDQASDVMATGSELCLHGIDAWRDADAGRAELAELTSVTGQSSAGVRMHWLYLAADSGRRLEEAGFTYDSTYGFNDAVGYRAGTSQVFRLPGSEHLLELPLVIMDSAMFFPRRMGLTRVRALELCRAIVANARRFGGTLVINWHDRSLAPERLWRRFYEDLLAEVERDERVWFATAGEAVDWFRWRRSIRFNEDLAGSVKIAASAARGDLPPAWIAVCRPTVGDEPLVQKLRFEDETVMSLPF